MKKVILIALIATCALIASPSDLSAKVRHVHRHYHVVRHRHHHHHWHRHAAYVIGTKSPSPSTNAPPSTQ